MTNEWFAEGLEVSVGGSFVHLCPFPAKHGPAFARVSFNRETFDRLLNDLKTARDKAWPKPVKPLCPSSRALLTYLQRHDAITPLKAREELEIEHLPRRIKDLKEHGHEIAVKYERSERGKRYGRYSLVKSKPWWDHPIPEGVFK